MPFRILGTYMRRREFITLAGGALLGRLGRWRSQPLRFPLWAIFGTPPTQKKKGHITTHYKRASRDTATLPDAMSFLNIVFRMKILNASGAWPPSLCH